MAEKTLNMAKKRAKTITAFVVISALLLVLFFISINLGSIKVSVGTLLKGLFVEYNEDVATIVDLRFPRVVISMLAGAALAVSGSLFQSVLKNPLADPGIIGVCSGAGFVAIVATACFPLLYNFIPIFGFLGGLFAFFLVYSLSYKQGLSPLRILLVGIAIEALFTGLSSALNSMSAGNMSGVASIVDGNITMKTWQDAQSLSLYVLPGLLMSVFCLKSCDLLALEDKTVQALGVNVNTRRFLISLVAVLLAASSTAIVGVISFLGLLAPHIGRLLIGNSHKKLVPFSMLLGAFIFLFADTLGRTIMPPYEINASVVMAVVGGPVFIFLLRKSGYIRGK